MCGYVLECSGLTPLLANGENAVKPVRSKALRALKTAEKRLNLAPFKTDLGFSGKPYLI